MKARWLLRLYPRAWRERYGDEFLALLEARPMGPRVVGDVLKAVTGEWVGVGRLHVPQTLVTLRSLVGYYCAGHLAWWALVSLLGESPGALAWTPAGLLVSAAIQARAAVVAITVVFLSAWALSRCPATVRLRVLDWMGLIVLIGALPLVIFLEHVGVGPSRELAIRYFGERVILWAAGHCFAADWALAIVRRQAPST